EREKAAGRAETARPALQGKGARLERRPLQLDDEFADVVAVEEHIDGVRGLFDALDDGFAALELAGHLPHAKFLARVHESGSVVEDDEAFDAEPLDEHLAKASQARILLGIARDEAAEDDATVEIHTVENGLHHGAANVFEVDVHAFGSSGSELFF